MAKKFDIKIDEELKTKSENFVEKSKSKMSYKSDFSGSMFSFDWVDEINEACPYLDDVIRNPKLVLINEEDIVKIEKAKKIGVASIKDLSRHTNYIEEVDYETNDVRPNKIMIERKEETFNIYENRFLFTLVKKVFKFVGEKEKELEDIESKSTKVLEFSSNTKTANELVDIEMKVSTKELPKGQDEDDFSKELAEAKKKISTINKYFAGWRRSEFIKTMEKLRVAEVRDPIKKTNIILMNPSFQVGEKLWDFLKKYQEDEQEQNNFATDGDDILKRILTESFLINYSVLDSIDSAKKVQKEKLAKYAILMINRQIEKAIEILLEAGFEFTREEIIEMLSVELLKQKDLDISGKDIKDKFKQEIEDYLERMQKVI